METNESILTRSIVGLDDRKVLGKMRELRVDCDALAVGHYIVSSATTNAPLVLPFANVIAVGDTFATVQSREDFLPASDMQAQALIADGFALIGAEVYTRTGNKLGAVATYAFDPVFGTVTSLTLDDGTVFTAESFVFFAPEFVFVDDGAKTAAELREGGEPVAEVVEVEEVVEEPAPLFVEEEPLLADDVALAEAEDEVVEALEEAIVEEEAEPVVELSDEDAELVEFLIGKVLTDDVTSADGVFTASRGVILTRELVEQAAAHDALLSLTMSVDE